MPLASGEHIGPYVVSGLLGAGGMGEVYRAKDPRLGREVALKLLPAEKFSNPERRQRFLREARAAAALNHPHIVTIHDISEDDGRLYVVMELIQGRTLDAWLAGQPLPWKTALSTAIGVASALEAAHGAGIIHRDLKPGNIMVDGAGRAKLLDFGLAKTAEASSSADSATKTIGSAADEPVTEEGAVLGTVSYMSPEQAQGLKVDARSDLFAFGAVLYEMLTGTRAFKSGTKISTITAILRDEPPPLTQLVPGAPRDLVKIVERCLRKDPARRYQTATDVKVALEDLKAESESSLPSPAPQPARRPIPWVPIGAGLLAVALAGAGFAWWKPGRENRAAVVIRQVNTGIESAGSPALSGDGRMVAFTAPDETNQYDLYVKIIDAGDPLRLTRTAASESWPVWSPDGSYLYFTRMASAAGADSERTVHAIPALGGSERSITKGTILDVSPNGQSLLVARRYLTAQSGGLFLVDLSGGTEVLLSQSKESTDLNGVFAPEGDAIFIVRRTGNGEQRLIRRALHGGLETELAIQGGRLVSLLNLVADPAALLVRYQPGEGLARVGLLPIAGGQVEPIPAVDARGGVTAAKNGKRLILTQTNQEWRLWRGGWGREARFEGIGSRPTLRYLSSPALSADGRRVVVSGVLQTAPEIWTGELTGGLMEPLTSLKTGSGSPAWSPDGTRIVFDTRHPADPELWMVAAKGGNPVRLTSQAGEDIVPTWTPDGQEILFTSGRSGRLELWKMPAAPGGAATQVTREGGFAGRYSPDGQWIYYLKTRANGQLWRIPSGGGREESVAPEVRSRNWALVPEGVFYLETPEGGQTIGTPRLFRFATKRWETVGPKTPKPVGIQGIALSPDGQGFYYSQRDELRVELMLVEGFR